MEEKSINREVAELKEKVDKLTSMFEELDKRILPVGTEGFVCCRSHDRNVVMFQVDARIFDKKD